MIGTMPNPLGMLRAGYGQVHALVTGQWSFSATDLIPGYHSLDNAARAWTSGETGGKIAAAFYVSDAIEEALGAYVGLRVLPEVFRRDPVCFLAGTLVEIDHGKVRIEDIGVGDRVLSRDPSTGEQAFKSVTRLFRGRTEKVVRVRVAELRPATQRGRTEHHDVGSTLGGDSEEGGDPEADPEPGQTLRCTPEHPFWVVDRGWVVAGELRAGDRLVGSKGEDVEVVAHEVVEERAEHYNFEVEGWHTYFVSETEQDPAVWVHNTCFQELKGTNLKGWSKGKEAPHFEKHGKGMGFSSGRDYTQAARDFARADVGEVVKVGNNAYFKFDAATNRTLIVTNRTIKTFYESTGRRSYLRAIAEHRRVLRTQSPPAPHGVTRNTAYDPVRR